jgi:branched-chain amino acid transport system substrate-binding protein
VIPARQLPGGGRRRPAGCGGGGLNPLAAPGVLTGSVTIGSYQPLTGAAAPGASEIAPASAAYFQYVNAHGGVYGRRIVYRYLDDHSSPALAPSIVHQVVQQDNVLAIFNGYGTDAHQAVAPFLTTARVPDVLAGSPCPCWDSPALPQTFGWQLDAIREGKILGAYLTRQYPHQPGPPGKHPRHPPAPHQPHQPLPTRTAQPAATRDRPATRGALAPRPAT